ncbi:uncharacterized protein LOC121387560 [Gigantopelta aegis]|uniref:uncharacterized protein LOC121387560 n=1 Tax=Gigantopelta aegis TaxID=1735272 RepID=UPI001B88CC8B|nr:uncharacterized protein LOC121387560 [Gigantopelta aegis]
MNIRATATILLLLFVETLGQCLPGWTMVSEEQCVMIGSAGTWHEAWTFCHVHGGFLADPGEQRQLRSNLLSDLLTQNGINITWSGIHVRDGKLLLDGVNPTTPQTFSDTWQWAVGEPSLDGDKLCGRALLPVTSRTQTADKVGIRKRSAANAPGRRRVNTRDNTDRRVNTRDWAAAPHQDVLRELELITGNGRQVEKKPTGLYSDYNRRDNRRRKRAAYLPGIIRRIKRAVQTVAQNAVVTMTDCEKKLPFICQSHGYRYSGVRQVSICGTGTFGNYYANRCYSMDTKAVTFNKAKEMCEEQGKQLGRYTTQFHVSLATSALQRFQRTQEVASSVTSLVWVQSDRDDCSVAFAFQTDQPTFSSAQTGIRWPCNSSLPYLCETHGVMPATVTLNLTHQLLDAQWVPNGAQLVLPSVSSMQKTLDRANNITCKADPFINQLQRITWFKDGRVLSSQYITINQSEATLHFASGRGIATFPGYYWCEVVNLNTTQTVQSVKFFVRHTEMELFAGTIGTKKRISPSEVSLFNYLGQTNDLLLSALQIRVERFNPFRLTPLRYRLQGDVVDFLAYRRPQTDRPMKRAITSRAERIERARTELIAELNVSRVDYIDVKSLQLYDIDVCLSTVIFDEIRDVAYQVRETPLGQSFRSNDICLVDGKPFAELKCAGNRLYGAKWQDPVFNTNCNFYQVDDSRVSQSLKNLSMTDITESNIGEVVRKAKVLTDDFELLNEKDLVYAADIVQKTSQLPVLSTEIAEDVLDLATNVMKKEKETLHKSENLGRAPSRIIRSLDTIDNIVDIPTSGALQLVTDAYGSTIWDLNKYATDPVIGLRLTDSAKELTNESLIAMFNADDLVFQGTEAAIVFPKRFVQKVIQDYGSSDIRLTMHVYRDTRLFTATENSTGRSTQYVLNSKVISARLSVDNKPITELNDVRVKTVFFPDRVLKADVRGNLTGCGFWDWRQNDGLGGWSLEGCTHVKVQNGRDVCHCDHLTNFAVLLDFYGQDELDSAHQLALSIITIIGLSLSIAGLSLTVLTFILFKKLRQTRPQQTLFNLALAQLCAWIVFLAGINQTQHDAGCIAVAVMLHYFITASFMWMLVEAILHYLLFVKVLGSYVSRYVLKTVIPAWGIPLLPVIIVLAIDYKMYRGGSTYCWMSLLPFYYAFALPIGLIILANLVLYIMVAVSICRRSNVSGNSSQSNTQRHLVSIRASVFCFILLGLSWMFGYLAISDARVVFQYVFTVTNTIQGFLIFLLFTARDKTVRDSWKSLCCPKQKTAASSTAKHVENVHLTGSTGASSNSSNRL